MVAGSGSGGVDRIGGLGAEHLFGLSTNPVRRHEIIRVWCEERVREWTNQRVRAQLRVGRPPGPESSIGKVHQGELNQRIQLLATALLGLQATAWSGAMPHEVRGMLRSRANTIEGGTTGVNKNILGERVLGLPREPDPWRGAAWREVPRA
jgi:alkylation response protein AidB-like acyl-CoA dehydrogenase